VDHPNETIRLLHERASVRQFADRPIEPDVLRAVLESGVHAPTGGMQPYSIISVSDAETKQALYDMDGCGQKQILNAPVDLLFCLDMHRSARWADLRDAPFTATASFEEWWISFQDVIICAQSIVTAADAMGLGSVYIGTVYWYFEKLRELFHMPEGVFPVVLLCMGYPRDARPAPRKKLGVDIVVHEGAYRDVSDEELLKAIDEKHGGRVDPTEKRVETLARAARRVGGPELEGRVRKAVERQGYLNAAQTIYGLAYCADRSVENNQGYLETLERAGFAWHKPYPLKD
jgi:FMN reductase [NAD(P)H]